VFSIQWTAEMAFAVIIGGIGTIEGPILGTIVYMVLQQTLQSHNAWYLIVLGVVAVAVAIFARRGLWGTLDSRFNLRLFPVGYYLWAPGERRGSGFPVSRLLSASKLARKRLCGDRVTGGLFPAAGAPMFGASAVIFISLLSVIRFPYIFVRAFGHFFILKIDRSSRKCRVTGCVGRP
jgi:hypothetical protein